MAETLSDINKFLASQSNQSAINGSSAVSSYSQEAVVIDTNDREYDKEIKFTNSNNEYWGKFYVETNDGTSATLLDVYNKTGEITQNITDLRTELIDKINNSANKLTEDFKNDDLTTLSSAILSSKTYTDIAVNERVSSNIMEISNVSSVLSAHTDNTLVHINPNTERDPITHKLIAESANTLHPTAISAIILSAANYTVNHISTIDCGRID